LEREIEVEQKYNVKLLGAGKHRFIDDIILDKEEEKINFGFDRF